MDKQTAKDLEKPRLRIVESATAISAMIDHLVPRQNDQPVLYIDLVGPNVSREGSISILAIMMHPSPSPQNIFFINVHKLGAVAFSTPGGRRCKTLKQILESPDIPVVFFDVRNDADALYAHFDIKLDRVEDVQLIENASRTNGIRKWYLDDLARCIKHDAQIDSRFKAYWKLFNKEGQKIIDSAKGHAPNVFDSPPWPECLMAYCFGGVYYLPHLRNLYYQQGEMKTDFWREKVANATRKRVSDAQKPDYQPYGKDRSLGPWLDESPTFLDLLQGLEQDWAYPRE